MSCIKQYVIHICFREKGKSDAQIYETDIVAHSIQDAKAAFGLWQLRTNPKFTNVDSPVRYTIVAAKKLGEVTASEKKKEWLRLHPDRVKSQIYVCPHCQETCQAPSIGCNYKYCPRCGREVIHDGPIKTTTY